MTRYIYLAGGSDERLTTVAPYIARVREAGLYVTHDWTDCEGYVSTPHPADEARFANDDLRGVRRASLVWILMPAAKSEGAAVELGHALALGKRVVVSGPSARNIFCRLADVCFDEHEAAFDWVVRQ